MANLNFHEIKLVTRLKLSKASSSFDSWYIRFIVVTLFLVSFQLMSCMPIAKLIYGIHKPKYLSNSAVVKYYNRLGLQDEIYRIKDYTEENRKQYRYLGNSMPDVLLFNSTGQLTKFEIDCSNDLDSIVALSPHEIDLMSQAGKSLKDFVGDTYVTNNLNNEDLTLLKMPLYVVKFAEYAGRLNKDNVPALVERLSSRRDVKYIILNMDYSMQE